jgi:CHAT domain-containing protein
LKFKLQKISQELQRAGLQRQERTDLTRELEKTETEYDIAEQKLKLLHVDYRSVTSIEPPQLNEIMGTLDPGTCLLEYWLGEDKLVIWVISGKRVESKVLTVKETDIINEIKALRRVISLKLDDLTGESIARLSGFLIEPVDALISAFTDIVIIPHKSLHFVPFNALMIEDKYLVERFNILYSPSSATYRFCAEKQYPGGKEFLGMALGDHRIGAFTTLPGTTSEVNYISQVYQGMTKKTGSEMSETFFKKNAGSYNYLHLATHGYFNKNQAVYSYILLSPDEENNGELTVKEIFNMNIDAGLVSLSACETGLGEITGGDELVGLSRAFIYAGAPAVIVSLWTVDDATTSVLMTRFYQYLNSGLTAMESISRAQRDLLQNDFMASAGRGLRSVTWDPDIQSRLQNRKPLQSRNPYYWAPFILIGNGNVK